MEELLDFYAELGDVQNAEKTYESLLRLGKVQPSRLGSLEMSGMSKFDPQQLERRRDREGVKGESSDHGNLWTQKGNVSPAAQHSPAL